MIKLKKLLFEGLEDELNEGEFCPQCLAEVIDGLHEGHQVTEAKF